jgi:hypothetical protein
MVRTWREAKDDTVELTLDVDDDLHKQDTVTSSSGFHQLPNMLIENNDNYPI